MRRENDKCNQDENQLRDFPGGPVVKNLPSNAGDVGLIPGQGTKIPHQFSSVQLLSCVWLCDPMDCSMPGFPVHHQLLEFTQTHVHWVGDAIQPSHPCHPLLLLPSIFPSIRVFSNESVLHIRWPKYWRFSFSISPSNEYSGLISFRMDWLDLLAVQGTLKSLLQHHSSKSINSSVLSLLHSPTLTSIHDHRKNQSLDYTDLCWQNNVSAFEYAI